ncbi:MAG: hypothetical protein HZB29_00215 [Nitrospinae bacterium]|nr:hypothetical protein [Nitrospinota bacterium]
MEQTARNPWQTYYMVVSATALATAFFTAVFYLFMPGASYLFVILLLTFNPMFLTFGVALIIIRGHYPVSIVNIASAFAGMVASSIPAFITGDADQNASDWEIAYTGASLSAAVFLVMLAATALNLRAGRNK